MLFWCSLLLGGQPAFAAEVDQFTLPPGQPVVLPDSKDVLNAEVNRLVQRAVTLANGRIMLVDHKRGSRWVQPVCDEARLYQFLRAELARS